MSTGSTGSDNYTIVPVVQITSTKQVLTINVQPFPQSQIYTNNGQIRLKVGASIIVEDNRVDLKQINNLANLNLLTYTRFNKKVSA